MGFIRRAFEFVALPSHSRTLGLVLMLVLVAAVSLTVYVAQQQQETRQRAASIPCGGVVCDPSQYCKSSGSDEFCADIPATPTLTPTPTPVKLTNCGDLLCKGAEKCVITASGGEGEPLLYSCVAPTPTPTLGPLSTDCNSDLDCPSGYFCDPGDNFCSKNPDPTPTPTNTPIPTPTPKTVTPIPTGPIKCGTELNIYYCDQGFSCSGATDNACIENTPTPPTLTRCTEFKHINTRVRKFKSNEASFDSINTCIRQFKGL